MDRLRKMVAVVADGNGATTSAARIQQHILGSGIQLDDFRLRTTMERLRTLGESPISFEAFVALVSDELMMVNRTFNRELVIPDWQEFCNDIELVFNRIADDCSGNNANYIPILRDTDPNKWGVALCSVDGQRLEIGDVDAAPRRRSAQDARSLSVLLQHRDDRLPALGDAGRRHVRQRRGVYA